MDIVCMVCQGTGVIVKINPSQLAIPKPTQIDFIKAGEKDLCPLCGGEGTVQTGFLAKKLGLKKDA